MGMVQTYQERMDEYRSQIPEDYHEIFTQLVGAGGNPKVLCGAIEYVTTEQTQEECASEWECSQVAIRNNYPAIVAMSDRDNITPSNTPETAADLVREIGAELDWVEGEEYSVTQAYEGASESVTVKKPGLASVRDAIVDG